MATLRASLRRCAEVVTALSTMVTVIPHGSPVPASTQPDQRNNNRRADRPGCVEGRLESRSVKPGEHRCIGRRRSAPFPAVHMHAGQVDAVCLIHQVRRNAPHESSIAGLCSQSDRARDCRDVFAPALGVAPRKHQRLRQIIGLEDEQRTEQERRERSHVQCSPLTRWWHAQNTPGRRGSCGSRPGDTLSSKLYQKIRTPRAAIPRYAAGSLYSEMILDEWIAPAGVWPARVSGAGPVRQVTTACARRAGFPQYVFLTEAIAMLLARAGRKAVRDVSHWPGGGSTIVVAVCPDRRGKM